MKDIINNAIKLATTAIILLAVSAASAQTISEKEEKIEGYRFEKRIVGQAHSKSSVLEIMVDAYHN